MSTTEDVFMSMGTFDQAEYERREKQISSVTAETDDERTNYEGRVEYTGEESVDDLLATFAASKSKASPAKRSPSGSD